MENNRTERLQNEFGFVGIGTFLYACFYTICMYKNKMGGIAYPFFLLGGLFFFCSCFKRLGLPFKKESKFYLISMVILGISTFTTGSLFIIWCNRFAVILLFVAFIINAFHEDRSWNFGTYFIRIMETMVGWIPQIPAPFKDMELFRKKQGKEGKGKGIYVLIGLCIAIPLFLVMWYLLMSADKIFMDISENFFELIRPGDVFMILFMTLWSFFFFYGMLAFLSRGKFDGAVEEKEGMQPVLGITVTLPLAVLYVIFSGVQIVCLFLGKIDLEKYSYSSYAREGFFQLLAVSIVNLILVLMGRSLFRESKVLKGILKTISLCTYVMIASSCYRMILYVENYHMTLLRFLVFWSLALLTVLLTGVLISIYKKKLPLFRYCMLVTTVFYLVLSLSHPDYWIAGYNISHMDKLAAEEESYREYQDVEYISHLSSDAAPVIAAYIKNDGRMKNHAWVGAYIGHQDFGQEKGDFREFNLSRMTAEMLLGDYGMAKK